jgi:alkylation response protein AidB-like acyl-CoA dehydrogenase
MERSDADRVEKLARQVVEENDPRHTPPREFLGACFDAGLSWVHFPPGLGGLGVPRGLQSRADAVLQGAGGPVPFTLNPIGYGMAAATLVEHGTPALARELLRPLATAEHMWCQLFSEPGAGSDLARLATSAAATVGSPGPEGSVGKLVAAELNQAIYEWCIEFLGHTGTLYGSYEMRRLERTGDYRGPVQQRFLRARANSIEGGTSEVLRNVLGERVLGLPSDLRADAGQPWKEISHG